MSSGGSRDTVPFLRGGGELGTLIGAHDWRATPLGRIDGWPAHLTAATALMLRSQVPIVMLWGNSGVMLYNDAYTPSSPGFAVHACSARTCAKAGPKWPPSTTT